MAHEVSDGPAILVVAAQPVPSDTVARIIRRLDTLDVLTAFDGTTRFILGPCRVCRGPFGDADPAPLAQVFRDEGLTVTASLLGPFAA